MIAHPCSQSFNSFKQRLSLTPLERLLDGAEFRPRGPMLTFMPGVGRVIRFAHQALFMGQMAVDFGRQPIAKKFKQGRILAVKQRQPQFGRPIEHFPVLCIDVRNLNRVFLRPFQTSHDPILRWESLQRQVLAWWRMRPARFFMR